VQSPAPEERPPGTIDGARLVLAILGSLVVLVAVVLIGFALFEPEGAPCASGELATNPFVNGRYEPRTELFGSVEEAEAFICHDVPEVQAEGWALERISAERTLPLEFLVEGDGLGVVTLGYLEDASGRPLTVDAAPFFGLSYFESQIPPDRTEEPVQVQGLSGTAYGFGINPDFVTVIWLDRTLEHRATVQLTPDFELQDLLEVLDSLK
jgi:hypothetical protein